MKPWEQYQTQSKKPWEQYQSQEPESKSFVEKVKEDYSRRVGMEQEAGEAYRKGEQTLPETFMQVTGKGVAGLASDVVGSGMGSALSAVTPDFIEEPAKKGLKNVLNYLGDTAAGDLAIQAANKYSELAEEYPRAARNVEALGNIGAYVGALTPIKGQSAVGAVLDTGKEAAKKTALATKSAGGAIQSGAVKGIVKALPDVDETALDVGRLAQKYEIPVSVPELTGSRAVKNIQKVSQELPFSGQADFRDKQMSSFNRALFKTVGMDADKFTPSNMDKAFTQVGKEFDDIGKGKTFNLGKEFAQGNSEILNEASAIYSKEAIGNYKNSVKQLLNEVDNTGKISGEKLNFFRSKINERARKAKNEETKEMLLDLENLIIEQMTDNDPLAKEAFSETKRKYKNLIVLEPLAAKAKMGNISPSLLDNRVNKVYGRSYVRGKAGDIGELARVGNDLLPELGGSDTAQKLLYMTGATGGAIANAPLTAAALLGNRVLLQDMIMRNPRVVKELLSDRDIMKLPPKDAKAVLDVVKGKK